MSFWRILALAVSGGAIFLTNPAHALPPGDGPKALVRAVGIENALSTLTHQVNIVGPTDDRAPITRIGPTLGLTPAEIDRIRKVTGVVVCKDKSGKMQSIASGGLFVTNDQILTSSHAFFDEDDAPLFDNHSCQFQTQSTPPQTARIDIERPHVFGNRTPHRVSTHDSSLDYSIVQLDHPISPGATPLGVSPAPVAVGETMIGVVGFEEDKDLKGGKFRGLPQQPYVMPCTVKQVIPANGDLPTGFRSDCDLSQGGSGGFNIVRRDGKLQVKGIFQTSSSQKQDYQPYSTEKGSYTYSLGTDGAIVDIARQLAGQEPLGTLARAQSPIYHIDAPDIHLPATEAPSRFQGQLAKALDIDTLYLGMPASQLGNRFARCSEPETGATPTYYGSKIGFFITPKNRVEDMFTFRRDGIVIRKAGDRAIYEEYAGSIQASCQSDNKKDSLLIFSPPWPTSRLAVIFQDTNFAPKTAPTGDMLLAQIRHKFGTPSIEIKDSKGAIGTLVYFWKDALLISPANAAKTKCNPPTIVSSQYFYIHTTFEHHLECEQIMTFGIRRDDATDTVSFLGIAAVDYQLLDKVAAQRTALESSLQHELDAFIRSEGGDPAARSKR